METIVTTTESETLDRGPDPRPLDRILGSRSHVRVLRAMVTKDPEESVGAREIARLAGVSHPRAAKVLSELRFAQFVVATKTRWGTVYDLNDEHFLAPQLWTLFDRRWFGELEDGIAQRFGLDVRVTEPDPNEWLLEL